MATVFDYARALAKAMRESDEGRRMRSLGAAVRKDARQEKLLRELRAAQYEYQVVQLQGQKPSKELTEKLQRAMGSVEKEQRLAEYLEAENAYGKLLVEVQNVLTEVFQPDVPGALKPK